MALAKPTLASIAGTVTLPHPGRGTKVVPVWIEAKHTTLGGKTRQEVMARKYQYVLVYEVMSVDTYDALEDKVEELVELTFTYGKWPQSTAGVTVLVELSDRNLVYGTGATNYWSGVTITLTEIDSRI